VNSLPWCEPSQNGWLWLLGLTRLYFNGIWGFLSDGGLHRVLLCIAISLAVSVAPIKMSTCQEWLGITGATKLTDKPGTHHKSTEAQSTQLPCNALRLMQANMTSIGLSLLPRTALKQKNRLARRLDLSGRSEPSHPDVRVNPIRESDELLNLHSDPYHIDDIHYKRSPAIEVRQMSVRAHLQPAVTRNKPRRPAEQLALHPLA